jgi:hypothetical protein
MAGVYKHIRKDKNEPFYFGIFKNQYRPYEKSRRNDIWDKIVAKTEYEVQIIKEGLTWEEACQMEKDLINEYGRIDKGTGILANLTDGGDGAVGLIRTEEHCKKISESLTGRQLSEEHKKNTSEGRKGIKDSKETKIKKSIAKKGNKPNNYGKPRSQSAINGTTKTLYGNTYSAGENNHKTNITNEIAIYIKTNWKSKCLVNGTKSLSQKFGISENSVWAIATNKRWIHV